MIRFSPHALTTLHKRKIPRHRVLLTVKSPDETIPSFRGRMLRRRLFGDTILEVITITEDTNITIITQYYLEGENENQLRQKN